MRSSSRSPPASLDSDLFLIARRDYEWISRSGLIRLDAATWSSFQAGYVGFAAWREIRDAASTGGKDGIVAHPGTAGGSVVISVARA